jgi:hypothetical protein
LSLTSLQGPVFTADRDGSGNPVNFAWAGNSPDTNVSLSTETLTHKESYTGLRTTDARIITETSASVSITVDDFKESNFAMAAYGVAAAITGGAITAEPVLTAAPKIGERYALKATGRVSAVTLYDNAVSITSTKYDVDPSGVIVFNDVAAMTGPITADYTNAASRQVGVFKTAPPEKHIRVDGYNTARTITGGDFERLILDAFKTRLDPLETLNLIHDEFGTMVINGSVLVDTAKSAASATGQFMRLIYFDA